MGSARSVFIIFAVLSALVLIELFFDAQQPPLIFGKTVSALPVNLFPALAALGILCFSVIDIVRGAVQIDPVPYESGQKGTARWVGVLLLLIVLCASVLDYAGYVLTMAVAAGLLSYAMGNRAPLSFLGLCVVFPALVYWLITDAFATYLPFGSLISSVVY